MVPGRVSGWGTGIAPSQPPQSHYPGYTPPHRSGSVSLPHGAYSGRNMVVGLISVDQLTLRLLFSGFRGITEVYNLLRIGRISNQLYIPGTE